MGTCISEMFSRGSIPVGKVEMLGPWTSVGLKHLFQESIHSNKVELLGPGGSIYIEILVPRGEQ